jgi:hypothetical protein
MTCKNARSAQAIDSHQREIGPCGGVFEFPKKLGFALAMSIQRFGRHESLNEHFWIK